MSEKFHLIAVRDDTGLETVRRLAWEIWPGVFSALLSPEQIDFMLHMMYDLDVLKRDLASGINIFLAFEDEEAVGYVTFGPAAEQETVKLHKLYLRSTVRGRGYGRKMIEKVKSLARELGYHRLVLNVNKGNAASIAVYRACGLETLASVVIPIGDGYCMDDYVMGCELN